MDELVFLFSFEEAAVDTKNCFENSYYMYRLVELYPMNHYDIGWLRHCRIQSRLVKVTACSMGEYFDGFVYFGI